MRYPRIIYAIKHNVTGKVYIGSTNQPLKVRYANHIGLLRKGKHSSKELQKDFIEFGEDFTVYKIGDIKDFNEKDKEYQMMLEYDTVNPKYGYNQGDWRKHNRESSIKMNFSANNDELLQHREKQWNE